MPRESHRQNLISTLSELSVLESAESIVGDIFAMELAEVYPYEKLDAFFPDPGCRFYILSILDTYFRHLKLETSEISSI
jgi:hypothetical protein